MIEVTLTRDELIFAAQGAVIRNADALLLGRRTIYGDPYRDLWANNIIGAVGECAVAKHFGRYWTPCYANPTGIADIGERLQVRSTTIPDGPLRVYDRDKTEQAFMLVVVRPPTCTIVGWLYGREARRDEWRSARSSETTWLVPQGHLRPIKAARPAGIGYAA